MEPTAAAAKKLANTTVKKPAPAAAAPAPAAAPAAAAAPATTAADPTAEAPKRKRRSRDELTPEEQKERDETNKYYRALRLKNPKNACHAMETFVNEISKFNYDEMKLVENFSEFSAAASKFLEMLQAKVAAMPKREARATKPEIPVGATVRFAEKHLGRYAGFFTAESRGRLLQSKNNAARVAWDGLGESVIPLAALELVP